MSTTDVAQPQDEQRGWRGVQHSPHAARRLFFKRLNAKLRKLGINPPDTKTGVDGTPPCFTLIGSSYSEWLVAASESLPPLRLDMPGEPNYCHDCLPAMRDFAHKHGACLFPHVAFETRTCEGETSVVGITRAPTVKLTPTLEVPLSPVAQKLPLPRAGRRG